MRVSDPRRRRRERGVHAQALLAAIRTRVQKACAGGAADAAKRIDLKDLGMTGGGMFYRGVPGMCQELSQ